MRLTIEPTARIERVNGTPCRVYLWAIAEPGRRFPFGFEQGLILDSDPEETSGAVQRPTT